MANITFTKGGSSFSFSKGREFPKDDPVQVKVVAAYSCGGSIYAYDKGIKERIHNLAFNRVPQTDYDNLADWLENVAVGPLNEFTYTDEDSVDHTVRLMDIKNPLKGVASGLYSGVIQLREEK
ncbi:MAG: hypothetical protein ABIJ37_07505 [Pseudomonadota bacterium]